MDWAGGDGRDEVGAGMCDMVHVGGRRGLGWLSRSAKMNICDTQHGGKGGHGSKSFDLWAWSL